MRRSMLALDLLPLQDPGDVCIRQINPLRGERISRYRECDMQSYCEQMMHQAFHQVEVAVSIQPPWTLPAVAVG